MSAAWILLAVALAQAPQDERQLPTLGLPGLIVFGTREALEARELHDEQLAAELEGAGFQVLDAETLRWHGAAIPQGGCVKTSCGAVAGVDQVLLGRLYVLNGSPIVGNFELRDVASDRSLWRGSIEVQDDAELVLAFHELARNVLPDASTRIAVAPTTYLGLSRAQWATTSLISGTVLALGGGVLLAVSAQQTDRVQRLGDISEPLLLRDALRLQKAIPLQQTLGGVAIGVGVTALMGGLLLWMNPETPAGLAVDINADSRGGGFVLSGVLP